MFHETLLESAPGVRPRRRWPMIVAAALEVTVCSVLVALPLFSTGIIPVSARPPVVLSQLDHVRIAQRPSSSTTENTGPSSPAPRSLYVSVADHGSRIHPSDPLPPGSEGPSLPLTIGDPSGPALSPCEVCLETARQRGPQHAGPHKVSEGVSEGYLFHRVEPVYPRIALISGVRGEVRLHAIISRDGTIESLTVISGHPLLARAAMEAVLQWRYRPYLLNHEPVEVETFITVTFNGR